MRERVKNALESNTFLGIIVIIFGISMTIVYFSIPSLSNEEFKECEKVARDIYNQQNSLIVEVPEQYTVEIVGETIIKVKTKSVITTGYVEAYLSDGELIYDRIDNVYGKAMLALVAGALVAFVCYLLLARYAYS